MAKKLICMILALVMCLSLCACGGKAEETTAPVTDDDPMVAIVEEIFADPYLEGVEHSGLYIVADTATETQVQYVMAQLNAKAQKQVEGYDHLYQCWVYTKKTFSDGSLYLPTTVCLPTEGSLDELYINGYSGISANNGCLGVGCQITTFQLSDDEVEELRALGGWEELNLDQVHLMRLLSEYLDQMDLSIESENVRYDFDISSAFAECKFDTEEGQRVTLLDLQVMDRDSTGAYVVSVIVVTGIMVDPAGERQLMSEAEEDVLRDVMNYYNLLSWYE